MASEKVAQSSSMGMSTVITHKVFGERAEESIRAAEKETSRLEGILSRFVPGSEISKINKSAGIRREKVGDETYEVLSRAVKISECCHGSFDVTIGPLVDLWSGARKRLEAPSEDEIRNAMRLVDYTGLIFDPQQRAIGLKNKGQSIDLGGIGKGYAADKVLEMLKKFGIKSAYTNFGGNVAVIGAKPDGAPWRVGIQHPRKENSLIAAVSVTGKSVVTSGDYQRFFTGNGGKRYHHILDPKTGYPSESGLVSATVVADDSVMADALSTMVFIAGKNGGIELLGSFPGTEAVVIDDRLDIYITEGLKSCFQAAENTKINILK